MLHYHYSYILLHVVLESFLLSSHYIYIMQTQDISQYDIPVIYINEYIYLYINVYIYFNESIHSVCSESLHSTIYHDDYTIST